MIAAYLQALSINIRLSSLYCSSEQREKLHGLKINILKIENKKEENEETCGVSDSLSTHQVFLIDTLEDFHI